MQEITLQTGLALTDKWQLVTAPMHGPQIQLVSGIIHHDTLSRIVIWLVSHPVTNDCISLCPITPVSNITSCGALPGEACKQIQQWTMNIIPGYTTTEQQTLIYKLSTSQFSYKKKQLVHQSS